MFRIRQDCEHSKAPAITTRAAFLAPLTVTWPDNVAPPVISKTDWSASGEADEVSKLAEVTIELSSQLIAQLAWEMRLDSTRNQRIQAHFLSSL